MNLRPILLALLLASVGLAHADEHTEAGDADTARQLNKKQYLIALSEYQLEKAVPAGVSEAEILGMIRDSDAIPVDTVQLTALADTLSMVKFGRRVTVTTGKIVNQNTTSQQTEQIEIGTHLQVMIASHAKGAIADIDYETLRLDGDGTGDSSPDVLTTTAQSSQVYEFGEKRLLVATTLGNSCCIVVTVREIP